MIQVEYPTSFSAKSLLQSASWADFQPGCAQRYTSRLVYPKFGRMYGFEFIICTGLLTLVKYVRKSVEGLSMFLFVFAFLGNTFYVLSILSSPKLDAPRAEAMAFLLESIPYLLGSGGTLIFDVTIVTQSFLYKPGRKPLTHQRARSSSHSHPRGTSYHPRGSSYSRGGSTARIQRSNSSTGIFGGGAASRTGSIARARPQQQYDYTARSRSTSAIVTDGYRNEEARALLSADSLAEDGAPDAVGILSSSDAQARRRRDGTLEGGDV